MENLLDHLRERYLALSRTQQLIANYILQNPQTACFLSLRELAKHTGTTEVTIINFAKKIGYPSFLEFKKNLQSQIQCMISSVERINFTIPNLASSSDLFEDVRNREAMALRQTYNNLKREDLSAASQLLKGARNIYLIAHEISRPMAIYAELRLKYLSRSVIDVPVLDAMSAARALQSATDADVYLAISFPLYYPYTVAIVRELSRRGIRGISITDRPTSQIVMPNGISLFCSSEDELFCNSITGPISAVNLLCSYLAVDIRDEFDDTQPQLLSLYETLQRDAELVQKSQAAYQRVFKENQ